MENTKNFRIYDGYLKIYALTGQNGFFYKVSIIAHGYGSIQFDTSGWITRSITAGKKSIREKKMVPIGYVELFQNWTKYGLSPNREVEKEWMQKMTEETNVVSSVEEPRYIPPEIEIFVDGKDDVILQNRLHDFKQVMYIDSTRYQILRQTLESTIPRYTFIPGNPIPDLLFLSMPDFRNMRRSSALANLLIGLFTGTKCVLGAPSARIIIRVLSSDTDVFRWFKGSNDWLTNTNIRYVS